jgi:protein-L-isoaspartate(D-aspartate) O-methyltransferase
MLGQNGEHTAAIDPNDHVSLHWDADQPIDPAALHGSLELPKAVIWSTATVGGEDSFDGIWLRLTATEPGTCRIAATPAAVDSGLCTPAIPVRTPALVEHDSLAYLAMHREQSRSRWTLGAIGHGPAGAQLARRLNDQIENWDTNRTKQPEIAAYPADTPGGPDGAPTIRKNHVQLVVSY